MRIGFMNGNEIGQLSVTLNILFGLLIFGYLYNKKIESLGNKAEGWTWLQVAVGVIVTQAGVGLLDLVLGWNALFLGAMAFAASGLPMVIGATRRHLEERARALRAIQDDS